MASPLRLLSLDGGGVRGLSSLIILEQIMRTVNPDSPPKPCDYFDLIGGTSTGGLIAIMLGRLNMSVEECIDAYLQLSSDVFQPKRSSFNLLGRASDALKVRGRFSSEELKKKIQEITVAAKEGANAKLKVESEPACRVFVCAVRGDTGVHTALLRNYESRQVKEVDCTIWEAARATSAASSFFDPIKIGKYGETFLDGATGCNNPVEKVLEEAMTIWHGARERIACLISIGTGQPAVNAFGKRLKDVAKTLIKIATETELTAANFQIHQAALLGDRRFTSKTYFRFNVGRGLETVGLEEHTARGRIAAATKEYLKTPGIDKDVELCAGILKSSAGNQLAQEIVTRLRALSAMDIDQHCSQVRDPEGQTFSWIRSRREFELTKSGNVSGIFHITGKPGCGKSVLAKHIYRLMESQMGWLNRDSTQRLLYYACNSRDEGRRTVLSVLGSLNAQLLEGESIFPPSLESRLENLSNTTLWTVTQLQDLLFCLATCPRSALPERSKIVFIIDAIDECDQGPLREDLLELFERIIEKRNSGIYVRFVVTSRPYADIRLPSAAILDLNVEDAIDEDIRRYIYHGTTRLIQKRPPFRAFRENIIAKLQDRAEKMFLLVELLLDRMLRLHDSSPKSIERLLSSLPSTLSEIYRDIWSAIPLSKQPRAKMVFSWLLCAFRPLSTEELSTAMATYDFHESCKEKQKLIGLSSVRSKYDVFHPLSKSHQRQIEPYKSLDLKGDLKVLFGPLIQIEGFDEDEYQNARSLDDTGLDIALAQLFESQQDEEIKFRDVEEVQPQSATSSSISSLRSFKVPPTPDISSRFSSQSAFSIIPERSPRINLCHQTVKEHFLGDSSFLDLATVHLEMANLCVRLQDGTIPGDEDTESVRTRSIEDLDGSEDYSQHWVAHRDTAVQLNPSFKGMVKRRKKKYDS